MSDPTSKPSQNEDDYFRKQDMELIARRKAEADRQRAAREKDERRAAHFMKCPKCGGDLGTEVYHNIQVDRCNDCKGVWFDAGEVESLVDKAPGAVGGFFGDVFGSLGGKKKK